MSNNNKRKKADNNRIIYHEPVLSKEEYVNMHAEAYLKAMNMYDAQKLNIDSENNVKQTFRTRLLLFASLLFKPKHINQKLLRRNVSDGLLSMLLTGSLGFIGWPLRIFGVILWASIIYDYVSTSVFNVHYLIAFFPLGLLSIYYGGIFCAASKDFENERDVNKLHTYTASIMASLAFILSLISAAVSIMHNFYQ